MDYCSSIFGKSLNTLSFEDVEMFFQTERIENDQLEFKSINSTGDINAKFLTIQKAVCAFLNSSGGLIIWGAPEEKSVSGANGKLCIGNLTPYNGILQKDTLVSKISDRTIPLPLNIRINPLTKDNKTIVLIEVDQSEYAPHQFESIYYMRIDGQSKPAPHHYIESLFKKIKFPNLEVYIKIVDSNVVSIGVKSYYSVSFRYFFFNWSPLQNEEDLYFRIFSTGIFSNSLDPTHSSLYKNEGHEYIVTDVKKVLYYSEPYSGFETLLFDPHSEYNKNGKGSLYISFGGKYSPLKTSRFTLAYTKNFNNIIVERNENKLAKDLHDELGTTKETILKELLT